MVMQLERLSKLLALKGDKFRATAFSTAARAVRQSGVPLEELKPGRVTGVGAGVIAVIQELLATGDCQRLRALEAELPASSSLGLTQVPGIGPKTAKKLFEEHGIATVEQLEEAALNGTVKMPKLLESIAFLKSRAAGANTDLRIPRATVEPLVTAMIAAIREVPGVITVEAAGSYRRKKETVKDVDLIVCLKDPAFREDVFRACAPFGAVQGDGDHKREVWATNPAIQVDVLIVDLATWGAAMCYFTGPKEHNVVLRALAKSRGLLVNQYGIWEGDKRLGGEHETDLYQLLGLKYLTPEEREATLVGFVPTGDLNAPS